MIKRKLITAAAGMLLLAASSAFAHPPHWAPAHGWHAKHHYRPYYYAPPAYVVVRPQPYYVYAPAPRVYYTPPPVVYSPAPVYPSWSVSIGGRF